MKGQTGESEKKVKSESDHKIKDIKTPDNKVSKKKDRTPRRETKVVGRFFFSLLRRDNLKVENNDLFFDNKVLKSNLLKNKSLFSTFKLSLKRRKKKKKLLHIGSSHEWTPSGQEEISVTGAGH